MRKITKKFVLAVLLSSAVVGAYAGTTSIQKTTSPPQALIFSTGAGFAAGAYFGLSGSDFPGSLLVANKKLISIDVQTTSYVGATTDVVSVCHMPPYTTQSNYCRNEIVPGTSVSLKDFNNLPFGNGASVVIRHNPTGRPNTFLNPAGTESVTYNYSY
ncbi:hypothetical protein AAFM49_09045 [Burkholderia pseudomallei]|uniref:hypothetical protein n=1 Tax=Burkholderia pseudomallei TaxID=28450 RepID=UPI00313E8CF0